MLAVRRIITTTVTQTTIIPIAISPTCHQDNPTTRITLITKTVIVTNNNSSASTKATSSITIITATNMKNINFIKTNKPQHKNNSPNTYPQKHYWKTPPTKPSTIKITNQTATKETTTTTMMMIEDDDLYFFYILFILIYLSIICMFKHKTKQQSISISIISIIIRIKTIYIQSLNSISNWNPWLWTWTY